MAILTAKYTEVQKNTEGLDTTPPNLDSAMGIIGSDPANRIKSVSEYIASNYPNASVTVTSNRAIATLSPTEAPDIFSGNFSSIFTSSDISAIFNQVAGWITGWSSGAHGALNDRYSVSGINIDAHTYFNTVTWANILDGDDTLIGGFGGDVLQDYGTNNIFQGLGGNDTFIAAAGGKNTAIFRGKGSEYIIAASKNIQYDGVTGVTGFTSSDSITNRDGFTQLVNINRLKFTDINVALDIGPSQNAGSVYMLYKAAFNRAPDEGGMGYWLAQKDGGSNIVTNIAQGFVNAPEFVAKYGANPTNADYVNKLYQNVLGREGEAGGVAYWNQELNAGNISKAAVLVQFATLAEGAAIVAPLIANGIPYTEWVG
jgi:hypothetical protein